MTPPLTSALCNETSKLLESARNRYSWTFHMRSTTFFSLITSTSAFRDRTAKFCSLRMVGSGNSESTFLSICSGTYRTRKLLEIKRRLCIGVALWNSADTDSIWHIPRRHIPAECGTYRLSSVTIDSTYIN